MRDFDTITKGINYLITSYKGLQLGPDEIIAWTNNLKAIEDDAFMPLVYMYCQSEPAPKSAADIMNFARKKMVDSALSSESFVQAFINAIEQMREDDFIYGDPSIEEQKDYVIWNIFARHPECRIDFVHDVVEDMVHEYFNSLYEAVRCGNTTTLSIVCSEIKSAYNKRLITSAGRTTLTLDTIKQLESNVSRNRELPQSNKFMEIEGGKEWN